MYIYVNGCVDKLQLVSDKKSNSGTLKYTINQTRCGVESIAADCL